MVLCEVTVIHCIDRVPHMVVAVSPLSTVIVFMKNNCSEELMELLFCQYWVLCLDFELAEPIVNK
jgi:hypothetical protein